MKRFIIILILYVLGGIVYVLFTDIYKNTCYTKAHFSDSRTWEIFDAKAGPRGNQVSTNYSYNVNGNKFNLTLHNSIPPFKEKKKILPIAYYSRFPKIASLTIRNIDYYPFLIIYFTLISGYLLYYLFTRKGIHFIKGSNNFADTNLEVIRILSFVIIIQASFIVNSVYNYFMRYVEFDTYNGFFSYFFRTLSISFLVISLIALLVAIIYNKIKKYISKGKNRSTNNKSRANSH